VPALSPRLRSPPARSEVARLDRSAAQRSVVLRMARRRLGVVRAQGLVYLASLGLVGGRRISEPPA